MIEFRDVSKRFPGGALAIDHIDLSIEPRQITVLVGSSGSGKTTLLRMINRMLDPTSGTITIDGADIATEPPVQLRRRIGYVMQNSGLLPHLSVVDNIATVPRLLGSSKKDARARAHELMDLVGLAPELTERYPHQLSGGQQQRVGVARGLATKPNILLMDEPFGALDPIIRTELQTELLRLQSELETTIVLVTHDIDEAFLLGDQIVILAPGGRMLQAGTPEEIIEKPADDFVAEFIGVAHGKRALHIKHTPYGPVLVDSAGRTQATLVDSGEGA